VIGDSPLFEKFSLDKDMEDDDLSKIGDKSPTLKCLDVNSLSRVKLPRVMLKTALPISVNG
jgi:hypothetical protein